MTKEEYMTSLTNENKIYALREQKDKSIICDIIENSKITKTMSEGQTKDLLYAAQLSEIEESGYVVNDDGYSVAALHYKDPQIDAPIVLDNFDRLQTNPNMIDIVQGMANYEMNKSRKAAIEKGKRVKRERRKQKAIIVGATIATIIALGATIVGSFKTAKKKDPTWTPSKGIKSTIEDVVNPDKDINTYDSMNPEDNPELYELGAGLSAEEAFPGTARH